MIRTRLFVATSVVAAFVSVSLPALAADYYFDSVAGDDSKDGQTEATAKKTFTVQSGSGNTMHLKRGSSWTMSLNLNGASITTYGDGARPVINGTITVSKSVVEGLAVKIPTGGDRAVNGFNVNGDATVSDCEVDGTGAKANVGFGIMGQNNKIIGNFVHDLGWSQSGGSMDNSGGAEGYMVMASNNEVAFNSAVNCQSVNSTLGGFEGGCLEIVNGKGGSTISNVSFHHNYCEKSVGLWEGCSGDFSASGGGIQENHGIIENVTVSYNIAVDSMWLYLLQPVNTDFRNLVFANNTIIHTPKSSEYWDAGGGHLMMALAVADYTNNDTGTKYTTDNQYYKKSGGFQPGTVIVKNNIFVDNVSSSRNMMFMHDLTDHSNNLFVPANASVGSLTLASTEKKVDLADLAFTSDYRLTADSKAAIDQGTTVGMNGNGSLAVTSVDASKFESTFNQDIDGHPVPCGSAPDIGASEYCEGAGGSSGTGGATSSTSSATGTGGSSSTTAAPTNGGSSSSTGNTKGGAGGKSSSSSSSPGKGGSSTASNSGTNDPAEGGSSNDPAEGGDSNDQGKGGDSNDSTSSSSESSDTGDTGGRTGNSSNNSSSPSNSGGNSASTKGSQGTGTNGTSIPGGAENSNPATTGEGDLVAAPEVGGCACRVEAQGSSSTRTTMGLLALVGGILLRRRRQDRA